MLVCDENIDLVYQYADADGKPFYTGRSRRLKSRDREHRKETGMLGQRLLSPHKLIVRGAFSDLLDAQEYELYLMFKDRTWCTYGGFNFYLGDMPGDQGTRARANSERMRRRHADPKFAAAHAEWSRETMRKLNTNPEFVKANAERIRKTINKLLTNPDFRAAQSERGRAIMAKLWANPEFAVAHAERARRLHANPEYAAARDERLRKLFTDPQFVIAQAERLSKIRTNPEFETARMNGLRKSNCQRWQINRGKTCVCGHHETSAIQLC